MPEPSDLSAAQRAVVLWCWQRLVALATSESGPIRRDLFTLGVPWAATRGATPSQRASLSRTLRRLHAQGLLVRISATGTRRTTHVLLTVDGMDLAKRLTRDGPATRG